MMRVLLEVETPLSTTVNVSNQILMLIYEKLKTNKQVKQEKHHKRQKFKGHFLFDFLDTNTNFKTL
jgi:CRISPR/Cas system endoribonuclease Cas6 (RAMP superfamily)